MRRRVLTSVVAITVAALLLGCGGGKSKLEKVEIFTQYYGVTFVEKFKIWATGPDEVVTREAFYEPDNYLYDGSTIHLTALRGETEAFQLVVNADYGNINDVEVKVSPLAGPGGAQLPAENVSVYFEYYLATTSPSNSNGRLGEIPDALPPLAQPFDLAKAQAQPLFVVVDVPRETKPGVYAGDVVVTARGAESEKLTLAVEVLDVALEPALAPPAFVELDYTALSAWEGGKAGEPVKPEALKPYLDMFRERGLRPLDHGYTQRRLTASEKKAAREWAEAAAGADPVFFPLSPTAEGKTSTLEDMAAEYARMYEAWEEEAPSTAVVWAAFPGGASAPFGERPGPEAAKWWRDLGAAAASWPGRPALAAATSPYRGAPGVSLARAGKGVTWWAPAFANVAAGPGSFRNLKGKHKYLLRADASGGDYLDGRRAGARLLSWYGYVWKAAGLIALAPPAGAVRPRNPWADDPMVGTAAAYGNALGSWFYPGEPAAVEGPVSSVRLELLRQGLEDWALFKLVEKKYGRAYVEERLQALLPYDLGDLSDLSGRELGNNQIWELRQALLAAAVGEAPEAGRRVDVSGRVVDAAGLGLRRARVSDGVFATYTGQDGSYRLAYRSGKGPLEVTLSGFRRNKTTGGTVTLYRRLRGLLPVFDFEAGIDASYWVSGSEGDALAVGEERDVVYEGRIALGAEFSCGRRSRLLNLYPRQKDFSKHHRFEFAAYNPQDFVVDLWLLLVDDEALDVDRQYRRRVTLRPRGWTRVSFRTPDLARNGEPRFDVKGDGTYAYKAAYRPDLTRIVGVGWEADGLVAAGGRDNEGSYRVVIDDVKLVIFE
ncbi:MAG: DUF4091 domain-containing protein [Candidatus Coatesbacteria bacterium]|nr:MAG: DUF4091 domain-containing protein [Candidatus Coatesbacteria bacterium]